MRFGNVENVQADVFPIAVLRAHDGRNLLELTAAAVEFAVQRVGRKMGGITGRRLEGIALAADQAFAVPIGAHAIEFFAHCPAVYVLPFEFLRQQQIGRSAANGGGTAKGQ